MIHEKTKGPSYFPQRQYIAVGRTVQGPFNLNDFRQLRCQLTKDFKLVSVSHTHRQTQHIRLQTWTFLFLLF